MTTSPAKTSKPNKPRLLSNFVLKQTMVITGVIFVSFVTIHMIGNLKVYQGADAYNSYAEWLRVVGYPLVPKKGILMALRVVLAVGALAHIASGLTLWLRGRKARGSHRRKNMQTEMSFGARWMVITGLILFVFVIVHVLDLTIGKIVQSSGFQPPTPDGTAYAYQNLVASFSRPWMAIFYIFVMLVAGLHIWHGWRTVLQDIGATGRRFRWIWTFIGGLIALAIVFGNAAIPTLVLAGVIK